MMEQKLLGAKDPYIREVERISLAGQLTGLNGKTGCFDCSCCSDPASRSTSEGGVEDGTARCGDCGTAVKGSTGSDVVKNHRACIECCKFLKKGKLPKKALVNDTWQGALPDQLRMKSYDNPSGLTEIEASMVAINLCITQTTILPSGKRWYN